MPKKVVFLDRDGVINRDSPDYIKNRQEFEFLPGSCRAVERLYSNGFTVIVITNQSAINRNMTSLEELEAIHGKMKSGVRAKGGLITDIFFCPHTPLEKCDCRKPKPGLIHTAQKKYGIDDLAASAMVGDSAKDIECARNAGCMAVLVRTGNGNEAEKILSGKKIFPDHIANDLYAAAEWLVSGS